MSKYFFILIIILPSCGTTGHIAFFNFNNSKSEVEIQILNVISKDSLYTVPPKWSEHTKGDYFERIYLYFKSNPEEIIQVGFSYDSATWKQSSSCRLAIISIYQGNQFQYERDLSNKEQNRIQERFEKQILSKINHYYITTKI